MSERLTTAFGPRATAEEVLGDADLHASAPAPRAHRRFLAA
ncbi:hypothetical protein [Streptomyces sp. 061-3]